MTLPLWQQLLLQPLTSEDLVGPDGTPVPSDLFDPSLEQLQEALPEWWTAKDTEGTNTYIVLDALAEQIDALSEVGDNFSLDSALTTATDPGLREEYAVIFRARQEELPLDGTNPLRAYLQELAAADGSYDWLIRQLLRLLVQPVNLNGTILGFPADGSGLIFDPVDGHLGPLFEPFDANTGPFMFPVDGSGLHFGVPSALGFPDDGTGDLLPAIFAQSTTLTFPGDPVGWVLIDINYDAHTWTVTTKSFFAFDRQAFARAIQRARPAHLFPASVIEVNH